MHLTLALQISSFASHCWCILADMLHVSWTCTVLIVSNVGHEHRGSTCCILPFDVLACWGDHGPPSVRACAATSAKIGTFVQAVLVCAAEVCTWDQRSFSLCSMFPEYPEYRPAHAIWACSQPAVKVISARQQCTEPSHLGSTLQQLGDALLVEGGRRGGEFEAVPVEGQVGGGDHHAPIVLVACSSRPVNSHPQLSS